MVGRLSIVVLALLLALMGATACIVSVMRQRRLKKQSQPPTVLFEPFQELGLLLLFALGGAVFTSFFILLPIVPPLMGCLLAVLASLGARNRLKARQAEAKEDVTAAQAVLRCHEWLCIGACLMVFAVLGWLASRLYFP